MVSPHDATGGFAGSGADVPPFDDDAWEDLLNFIEEKRVIPILGPELLRVETEGGSRLLYDWLAERLAARLGVDLGQLPPPPTLNDVVCWYLAARGRREEAYTRLRTILRETNFAPPPALRQLAQITDFDLFVTTTFDPLLEQAINLERFAGAASTEVIAYAPNRVADLTVERERQQRPVVYHLLGRLSASPTYVISDEDTLEFVCALQSEHLTPEKLFHELEHNHLLLIGSNFSNWLARLFLRMAKRRRLSDPRDVGEVVADSQSAKDSRLMSFLQQVSVRTRVYSGAERFVAELHERWLRRRGRDAGSAAMAAPALEPQRFLPPQREMPENAVFISYAREDLPAVQRLKAGLDAAGVTTWFDMERLESGDDYDRKIRQNIGRCAFFVPVVSATTQRRLEAYFRREWSYAVDRSRNIAEGAVFILPVCIDGTTEAEALVPEKFKAVHFSRLPGGTVTPEFARRLAELFGSRVR
ncbi:MAG: toll/interleukin-1 receptor domain-containing protein [Verrucomicrobia bacterium]|nr:toll/interleukin-1 receptor domain-containing protein [Verrucomicrobiota bacterium]